LAVLKMVFYCEWPLQGFRRILKELNANSHNSPTGPKMPSVSQQAITPRSRKQRGGELSVQKPKSRGFLGGGKREWKTTKAFLFGRNIKGRSEGSRGQFWVPKNNLKTENQRQQRESMCPSTPKKGSESRGNPPMR